MRTKAVYLKYCNESMQVLTTDPTVTSALPPELQQPCQSHISHTLTHLFVIFLTLNETQNSSLK